MNGKIIIDNPDLKLFPIHSIEDFKAFLYYYAECAAKVKVHHKPTYESRFDENGDEFSLSDIWYDTKKKEYWTLMYISKNRMGWWRFAKVIEGIAKTMYPDFMEWRRAVLKEEALNRKNIN
jgi:hypothetical protein